MEQQYEVEVRHAVKDFLGLHQAVSGENRRRIFIMILCCFPIGMCLGYSSVALKNILFSIVGTPNSIIIDYIANLSIFLLLFFPVMRGISQYFTLHRFDPKGQFLAQQKYTISPEAFAIQAEHFYSRIGWQGILRLDIKNDLLLFYTDKMAAVVIPKRCFASPEAAAAFYQQAQSYWQAARQQPVSQPPAPEGQA